METLLLLPIIATIVLVYVATRQAHARWGTVRGPAVEVGTGPFRRGETTQTTMRKVPLSVQLIAAVNGFWGLVTIFAFVPAGLFFVLIGIDNMSEPVLGAVMSGGVFWISTGGAIISTLLIGSVFWLLRRSRHLRLVYPTAVLSVLHHIAVFAVFGTIELLTSRNGSSMDLIGFVAIASTIGVALAGALAWATRLATTTDTE